MCISVPSALRSLICDPTCFQLSACLCPWCLASCQLQLSAPYSMGVRAGLTSDLSTWRRSGLGVLLLPLAHLSCIFLQQPGWLHSWGRPPPSPHLPD